MPLLDEGSIERLLSQLPNWCEYDGDSSAAIFIGGVGFEERSSACFERWCDCSRDDGVALLIEYTTATEETAIQRGRFEAAAHASGVSATYMLHSPTETYGNVLRFLASCPGEWDLILDLSSLSSYVVFPAMAAILDSRRKGGMSVCYAEAEEYFPSEDEWVAFQKLAGTVGDELERARLFEQYYFQSRGASVVYESAHFPGSNRGTLPTRLIVIPDFAFVRVQRMMSFVTGRYATSRDSDIWMIGLPPKVHERGWRHDALWEMFGRPSNRRTISTLQYKETIRALHELWNELYLEESLVLATLGSKAQHLGASVFLRMHREVGLVLSEPEEYVSGRFSAGVGSMWVLHFGAVEALVEVLEGWNDVRVGWEPD